MGKQMEVGKEAAQDRRVHENRPLKSRGEPGNQGGSQGRPLQGEGVCEQRHRGARGVVSQGGAGQLPGCRLSRWFCGAEQDWNGGSVRTWGPEVEVKGLRR